MLKQFNHIWKNATVHNKYQIVLRRFVGSSTVVQVHVNQFNLINPSNKNFQSRRQLLCAFGHGQYQIRCNNNTAINTNLNRSKNVASKYKQMEANLKWRDDPVITTLDTPQFKTILRKNILDLVAIFEKYNYEIRIAGGAVR